MATPIVIGGKKIGRLRASWLLFKEAWKFLQADKEMMLIPLLTGLINLCLFGLLVTGFVLLGAWEGLTDPDAPLRAIDYAFIFGAYLIGAFTLALSQAAMVHTVYTRAHDGDATLGQSLGVAFSHWQSLFVWSAITSTVGLILNAIAERSQLLGKLLAFFLGSAWGVLTYFVVPAIVLDKKSAVEAIPHAAMVFKRTWGESLVSNISLGAFFMVAHLLVLASFVGLIIVGVSYLNLPLIILACVLVVLWLIVAGLAQSALQGVLKTLLYIYASEQTIPANFNRELLEGMLARRPVPVAQPVTAPVDAMPDVRA